MHECGEIRDTKFWVNSMDILPKTHLICLRQLIINSWSHKFSLHVMLFLSRANQNIKIQLYKIFLALFTLLFVRSMFRSASLELDGRNIMLFLRYSTITVNHWWQNHAVFLSREIQPDMSPNLFLYTILTCYFYTWLKYSSELKSAEYFLCLRLTKWAMLFVRSPWSVRGRVNYFV